MCSSTLLRIHNKTIYQAPIRSRSTSTCNVYRYCDCSTLSVFILIPSCIGSRTFHRFLATFRLILNTVDTTLNECFIIHTFSTTPVCLTQVLLQKMNTIYEQYTNLNWNFHIVCLPTIYVDRVQPKASVVRSSRKKQPVLTLSPNF